MDWWKRLKGSSLARWGGAMKQPLLPEPGSRAAVVAMVLRSEKEQAPHHQTTDRSAARLRRIAATVHRHDRRLIAGLRQGWVTAAEAVEYLDTQQPHARLTELRDCGLAINAMWVRTTTTTGNERRVKAYRIEDDKAGQ